MFNIGLNSIVAKTIQKKFNSPYVVIKEGTATLLSMSNYFSLFVAISESAAVGYLSKSLRF